MSNNNHHPLVIAISAISTLIGGGGLYLQWAEHNQIEKNSVVIEQSQPHASEMQIVEKQIIIEKTTHAQTDGHKIDNASKLPAINFKEDLPITAPTEQFTKEQKIVKSPVDDLELPPAKGFDDFLEKDNL